MGTEVGEFTGAHVGSGSELATTGAAAKEQHEIQAAITIAKRFPRNEAACFQKLMLAAARPSFAEDAAYSFPRGDKEVTGPSVNLAREAARIWGNIRYGLYVVRDDEDSRLIRGFAWDVETNTKVEVEDDFKKLIQRKVKGGKPGETTWLIPDERDLRELTNRRGAILLRNAILQVLPKDLIEDALFTCGQALEKSAGENPEAARKRLLVDFGSINVSVEQIERKVGHPFAQSTPKELAELRGICKSIQDGHTTWAEYTKEEKPVEKTSPQTDALAEAQAKLKAEREKGQEDGLAVGARHTAAPPENQDAPAPKTKITFREACDRLNLSESVKEIAAVMNEADGLDLTKDERSKLIATKDQAIKELSKKKK